LNRYCKETEMKTTIAFATMVLFLIAGGAALAATTPVHPTMQKCQRLMKQFDDALPTHSTVPKIAAAKELRSKGQAACDAGNYQAGISDLRAGIRDLGLRSVSRKRAAK
jgi:hypothetical protein